MTVEFWTGRPEFETTHEMAARDELIEALQTTFGDYDGLVAAVFDFSCGADLDLAVFKRNAITVVELKQCASPIEGGENGAWRTVDAAGRSAYLKGGRYGNPFQQAKAYRYALIRYLYAHAAAFLPQQKAAQAAFDHVSAMVAIAPDLHPDSLLDFDFDGLPWFHVLGLPSVAARLNHIRSPKINLADGEIRRLLQNVLKCSPLVSRTRAAKPQSEAATMGRAAASQPPGGPPGAARYQPAGHAGEAGGIDTQAGQGLQVFVDAEEPYLRWLSAHPAGFVVNTARTPSPSYMVLRRATCPSISRYAGRATPGGFTERAYIKICAEEIAPLREWAKSRGRTDGSFSCACGLCKPPTC